MVFGTIDRSLARYPFHFRFVALASIDVSEFWLDSR